MSPTSNFCSNCQLLFYDPSKVTNLGLPASDRFIPLDYHLEDDFPFLPRLVASAAQGCLACDFLNRVVRNHCSSDLAFTRLRRDEANRLQANPDATPHKIQLVLDRFYYLGVEFLRDPSTVGPWYISGEVRLGSAFSAIRIDVGYDSRGRIRVFPSGLDLQSLRRVYDCARVCVEGKSDGHANCPKSTENPAPLRLVDVMSGDTIRLIETRGLNLRYAALSYCWGSCKAGGTRTSNVADRMVAFKLSSLPHTLQDSIVLARTLKISYIWIDRICIVQGSGEWATEAGKMMSYYANAYLTIAPVACGSAEQKFLDPPERWVSERLSGLWVGKPERVLQFNHPGWDHVEREVDRSAWNQRAWTFQERRLSARSVFFGRNGIRFECRGAAFEERNFYDFAHQNPEVFLPLPDTQSPEWNDTEKVRAKWYNLVTEYAERHLAFESDRLIALSGVAEKFGLLLGGNDEYISGFWKNDLCHGLCWRFWKGFSWGLGDAQSFTKSLSFPSWSWCCMKRPITWTDGVGSIPCAELMETVKSFDDGNLAVKGETVKLVLETWAFPAGILARNVPDTLAIHVRLDAEQEPTEDMSVLSEYTAVVLSVYLEGSDEAQWAVSRTSTLHEVYGLIVSHAGSQYSCIEEYTRVGMFEILCDMDAEHDGAGQSMTESFYHQIYGSRCVLVLI